jgi:hypothetical protein
MLSFRHSSVCVCFVLLLAMASCEIAGVADDDEGGPRLVKVENVELHEPDSLYIGRPRSFAVDRADGSFVIADAFADRAIRYDRSGMAMTVYGQRGSGPGEFTAIGAVIPFDSLLIVEDVSRGVLNLFDLPSGKYLRERPYTGVIGGTARIGDTLLFGSLNLARKTSLVSWDLRNNSTTFSVALPPAYSASEPLAAVFPGSAVAAWADTLLVGFSGTKDLLLTNLRGQLLETISVPRRWRRGVPADVAEQLDGVSFADLFSLISHLSTLARVPNGQFLLIHRDQTIDPSRNISSRVYATLLSADRKTACVDRELPTPQESQSLVAIRGDTIFVLEQAVAGGDAMTSVTMYKVLDDTCSWITTEP